MFDMRPYNRKNAIFSYNPFRTMEDMERRFFDDPFGFFDGKALAEFKTDIADNGKEYVLETDLPGFDKGDINLDINGDVLTIHAQRHSSYEQKDKKDTFIRCERSFGSYSRQFNVSGVDTDKIKAKYDNGVLKLTLPKKDPDGRQSKRLEIE